MMLAELTELLAVIPRPAPREEYERQVVQENALGKHTASNRRLTFQRLTELYALDPAVPIFRVLLRLWDADERAQPLLALLCALSRDPLLRVTAPVVIDLTPGQELLRTSMTHAIQEASGSRFNDALVDKVARNAGSTWTQSGHLNGRVRKIRHLVRPTYGAAAFAVWLGWVQGLAGESLVKSSWGRALDASPSELTDLALTAKRHGLLSARVGGGVVEIDPTMLDPLEPN